MNRQTKSKGKGAKRARAKRHRQTAIPVASDSAKDGATRPPARFTTGKTPLSQWGTSQDSFLSLTTISVRESRIEFGDGTVTYNGGSVNPGSLGTWYVYADDPGYAGGAVTYLATANESNVYASNGRIFFGVITTVVGGGAAGEELPPPFPLPFPLADFWIKSANLEKSSVTGVTEARMASLDDLKKTVTEQQFAERVRRVATYLRSRPGRIEAGQPAHEQPEVSAPESLKTGRRAAVDAYIVEVREKTGKRIKRADIWKAAGYIDRTEFERWQREDPKTNRAAHDNFTRVLTQKPHLGPHPK